MRTNSFAGAVARERLVPDWYRDWLNTWGLNLKIVYLREF